MKRARGNTNVHYIRMKATLFCFSQSMLHSVKEPLSGKIPFLPGVYKSITYNFEFMICLCVQKIIKSCKEILYIKNAMIFKSCCCKWAPLNVSAQCYVILKHLKKRQNPNDPNVPPSVKTNTEQDVFLQFMLNLGICLSLG